MIPLKLSRGLLVFAGLSGAILSAQTPVSTSQNPLQANRPARSTQSPAANFPTNLTITPEGIADMRLMPGSMINVQVFEESDLDGSYRVDNQGNVVIPLVGSVKIGSLTLREAEVAIQKQLVAAEILNDPHVTVNVVDYGTQTVVVAGEVTAPGRLPIITPRRLQDILAMVGGPTPLAGDEITIHHAGDPSDASQTVHYNAATGGRAGLDTMIAPGDTVFVKRAGSIYVLGAVYRPGGFIMQEQGSLNVVQALALAYGTSPEASIPRVRILRKSSDGTYGFIRVPLDKIQKGRADPTPLQAEDIVYVPPSTLKEAAIAARSLLSGVAGAAVYRVP
jgi:polysaccharide export outer membrane protein